MCICTTAFFSYFELTDRESHRTLFALVNVQNFGAPSFDDKKLEVVAVFGSMQMAMSRVINLQHHRIAQVTHIPARTPL